MERPSTKATRWIKFIGGRNLIFTLFAGVLLGALIFVFYHVRFIFNPLLIIFKTISAPILLALILYYLLDPIVNFFEKKGIKRIFSILGIAIVLLLLVAAFSVWAVPKIYSQTANLMNDFPRHVDSFNLTLQDLVAGTLLESPIEEVFGSLEDLVYQVINTLSDSLGDIQRIVGDLFSTVSGFFVILFTSPIIAFFLLKDAKQFHRYFLKLLPPKFREDSNELGAILNSQVGDYLKGQFIVALANGLIVFAGFLIIGMPYGLPLAILVTITSVIPYIGPFIAFVPCAVIAVLHSFQMLIGLIIVWIVEQILNGNVIEPKVLGDQLKVHPVTIVLVLLVMGNLFGLFGLVFGIPTYTIFKAFGVFLFRKFKQRYNRYYGADEGEYENTEFSQEEYPNN
ncbi:AI-2E family transporter [Enterococcus raffinosus]|uniref:AI-2E family transporter n=1 Tax=Enterococcus raffinosus TaxID=71452 RepID=A0AAW8T9X9_9ENTE|nr:AI-2E family transporter [Enterococcus raffinosus]MDT2524276.1 AI-2E family transporter [Enterococcus raffinosus]MDT2530051.1 AI-2E family transporter [Enterococcus raffinosus]MDT2534986.1 AI-2E family transporter [Enterococcus raffinosus]MDT2545007.1 AI-2E family transporter [Enterococcus raffinosus]MDT2554893.1 AI-2E family transporter [Enterococcus raffinosus]